MRPGRARLFRLRVRCFALIVLQFRPEKNFMFIAGNVFFLPVDVVSLIVAVVEASLVVADVFAVFVVVVDHLL